MKRYVLTIGIFSCIIYSAHAQLLKPLPVEYLYDKPQQKAFQYAAFPDENILHVNVVSTQLPLKFNFKYELPKGAIFCRMEDAIYSKLNFWVKLRMGTDERYSNWKNSMLLKKEEDKQQGNKRSSISYTKFIGSNFLLVRREHET